MSVKKVTLTAHAKSKRQNEASEPTTQQKKIISQPCHCVLSCASLFWCCPHRLRRVSGGRSIFWWGPGGPRRPKLISNHRKFSGIFRNKVRNSPEYIGHCPATAVPEYASGPAEWSYPQARGGRIIRWGGRIIRCGGFAPYSTCTKLHCTHTKYIAAGLVPHLVTHGCSKPVAPL